MAKTFISYSANNNPYTLKKTKTNIMPFFPSLSKTLPNKDIPA